MHSRGHRFAVPVLVPTCSAPVLHAERRIVPVLPVTSSCCRLGMLPTVPVQDVMMAGLTLVPLVVRVVVVPMLVVIAVVVMVVVVAVVVAFPVPRVMTAVWLEPQQVLPPVVHRVEEAFLMKKPQDHCTCKPQAENSVC
jgi:hypothetical protein